MKRGKYWIGGLAALGAALVAAREDVVVNLLLITASAAFAISAEQWEDADVIAAPNKIVRNHLMIRGVQKNT